MASRSSERRTTQNPRNTQKTSISAISACSALIVVVCVVVAAQQPAERARTEALARRAADRLQALQRESDRLASQESTLLGDLRKLEIEREIKAAELKQVDTEAATVQAELGATTARMTALRTSELAERPELAGRLIEIYKLGRARYLRLLLSTPDLRRLGQATRTVAAMGKLDRDRIVSHQRTLDNLKSTRVTLEQRGRQLAALRTAAAKAETAAQRAAQARSDLIRDIDRKRDLNAQLVGELQAAQQKVQATLRDLASGSTAVALPALPLRPFRGDLDWPVDGTVRRRFGRASASNGIEITATEGSNVQAIHDGVVAFAGDFSGFGNLVIVEHGPQTFSLYGDLLDLNVKKGARLEHGQAVGTVGPMPSGSAGLYFELRVDGQPVDPLQWLKKR
jgi:septal ring factor EnvC (AmiA/AmiB activator)